MPDKDIFKQHRSPINPNEFDDGGTSEESEVSAMRAHLQGDMQMAGTPPAAQQPQMTHMTGVIPPEVKAAMRQQPQQFANHPLNQPQFTQPPNQPQFTQPTQPVYDDVAPPTAMTDAQAMYANARKLMKQDPQEPQQQLFNPEFDPKEAQQRFNPRESQYAQFKDPRYEEAIRKLTGLAGYEEIELPSKGKFYLRGEGPTNGVLHIRKMTGTEEQILTTPRYIKKNQTLNMIFKECIGEQINPNLLLSEDRTFLLIYLRGISYSPIYDVEVKCPDCTKSFQNHIHLNGLNVNFCPEDFGPEDLVDTLPNSGLSVRYRLSCGKDETTVQEHREQRIKQWGAEVADDTTIFRASLLVEEIAGVSNKLMIQQLISKLPIGDMAYLRELINEPPFGVDTKVGIICPLCSHEFEIDMPMELSFFFPKSILQRKKKQRA